MKTLFKVILLLTVILKGSAFVTGQHLPKGKEAEIFMLYNIDFLSPADARYKARSGGKTALFDYDYYFRDASGKYAFYVMITEVSDNALLSEAPHAELVRSVAHMATNDEDASILMRSLSGAALDSLGADWAAEARFRPKRQYTRYSRARLLGMLRSEDVFVTVLYLYNSLEGVADRIRLGPRRNQ